MRGPKYQNPVDAVSNLSGESILSSPEAKQAFKDLALTAALSHIIQNGLPNIPGSSGTPIQHNTFGADAVHRVISQGLSDQENADAQRSLPGSIPDLLQDARLVVPTADGVLLAWANGVFAHVDRDGIVDFIRSSLEPGRMFALMLRSLARALEEGHLTRNAILNSAQDVGLTIDVVDPNSVGRPIFSSGESSLGTSGSPSESLPTGGNDGTIDAETSSSNNPQCGLRLRRSLSDSDLRIQELDFDFITHLAKERAKQSRQSSHAACSSSGGGMPPDDPRNNRNRWGSGPSGGGRDRVNNMKEFFETPFGQKLKGKVQKTNYTYQGQGVYRLTEGGRHVLLDKGDLMYQKSGPQL